MMPKKLTHVTGEGKIKMVDVTPKEPMLRRAVAWGVIRMRKPTLRLIAAGRAPKGDVFNAARLAGIMAAKKTSELIPLCHPLPLSAVRVELSPQPEKGAIEIEAEVKTEAKTGVEMEALTAVAVAALTVYDMLKAVDKTMEIGEIRLIKKIKFLRR